MVDISIIVTNYNYGLFLDRCIRSCLKQRSVSHEIIVVDDCSTDNSMEIISPFLSDITLIQNKTNLGVAGSSNVGIANAKGRFIIRVDSDDFVHEDMCFFLWSYLKMNRDAFCVSCDYYLVDKLENKIERKYADTDNISCGVMYRKEMLVQLGGYDDKMKHREEEELRKRLDEDYNIHHLRMPFYRYRKHGNNKTTTDEYKKWKI